MDLTDGEVKLDLTLIIESRKEFYYKIIKVDTLEYIGTCCLCLEKNENNKYLGNIGYEVFKDYQGNNYAYKASKIVAKVAESYGIDNLVITANPKNLASIKVIDKLGAHFVKVEKVPKKHRLYKQGDRYVSIYEWHLKEEGEKRI